MIAVIKLPEHTIGNKFYRQAPTSFTSGHRCRLESNMLNEQELRSALMIGRGLRQNKEFAYSLGRLDLFLTFAESGDDGNNQLCRDGVEIVFVDAKDSTIRPHEICRLIKLNDRYKGIPVVFIYDGDAPVGDVINAFHAGADDCFTGDFDQDQFMARVEWLMTRRNSEAALRQYYSELRSRQTQTLDVVKATANLMASIDSGFRDRAPIDGCDNRDLFEERLEIGMGLIKSLASILENQIDSFDISKLTEGKYRSDPIHVDAQFPSALGSRAYEIGTVG